MARRRRPVQISLDQLLAAAPQLQRQHAVCTDQGLRVTRAQLWRCRDGAYTARLVWRGAGAGGVGLSLESTVRGIVL